MLCRNGRRGHLWFAREYNLTANSGFYTLSGLFSEMFLEPLMQECSVDMYPSQWLWVLPTIANRSFEDIFRGSFFHSFV